MAKIEDIITGLVEPVITEKNMELVEVNFVKEGQDWFLRIFIDKEDGIDLDDCEDVSRTVSKLLDEYDPITQAYHLEVSSPGIERPLKNTRDYLRFTGSSIQVKTFVPIAGNKKLTGLLEKADDDEITIIVGQDKINIAREKIAKATLVWED
ncbi:MAG: ribosome maturation factor RimP [Peptococcaceae bacterium]